MKKITLYLVGVLLLAVGCLSLPRSFHALSYRNQTVYFDRNHFYKVGPLSKEWELSYAKKPGIIFKNSRTGATIATEAVCGAAFEDSPLSMLTANLFAGMKDVKKIKEENWMLGERGALYTNASATLDGVLVFLNVVIVKKNSCEFDFYSISVPSFGEETKADFLEFVKGFNY